MTSEGPSPASSSIDHLSNDSRGNDGDADSGGSSSAPPTKVAPSPSIAVPVSAIVSSTTGPGVVDKRQISAVIVPVTKANSDANTLTEFIKMPGVSNGLAGKLVPAGNVGQNVTYLGTFIGKDCLSQKVLVTPVKGKDGLTRIILPRSMAAAAAKTTTLSTVSSTTTSSMGTHPTISLSVVNSKGKSIVLSSKAAIPFDSAASSGGITSKPNIIRHKSSDNKMFANAILKNVIHATVKPGAPPKVILAPVPSKQAESTASSSSADKEKTVNPEVNSTPPTTDKTDSSSDDKAVSENKQPSVEQLPKKIDEVVNGHLEKDTTVLPATVPSSENGESNSADKPDDLVSSSSHSVPAPAAAPVSAPSTVAPLSPVVDRARKRKGQVATTLEPVVKMLPQQQENVKILPGAEDINPFKVLEWDSQGVGVIPDSDIKMFVNDYGMLEVHEESLEQKGAKSKRDPKNIYCCIACNCYGLIQEFFNENFCSAACRDQMHAQQQAICLKIEDNQECDNAGDGAQKDDEFYNIESDIIEEEVEVRTEGDVNIDGDESNSQSSNSSSSRSVPNRSRLLVKRPGWQQHQAGGKQLNRAKASEMNHSSSKGSLAGKTTGKSLQGASYKAGRNVGRLTDDDRNRFLLAQDLDPGLSLKSDLIRKKEELMSLDKPFPWADYLAHVRGRPAWVKLFNNPFPPGPNNFKVGYKLEAIDPEHQSYFCVVTVVDVKGYRIKLHFDNYPKNYDFWVNVDSPNIFPCGFCTRHGIQLQPPLGIKKSTFGWVSYNTMQKSRAAPMICFPNYRTNNTCTNLFRVGMKLEAVDRKNTFLVCVATISGVIDNRILVHFDTWSDIYDYWVDITSPYIHPVGWSKANNRTLTPPNGFKISEFKWDEYLKLTGSVAAPENAFPLRPPLEFKRGTKLEAVDRRAPHLLRVATIKETLPYQVKITFDGFPDHFGFWTDDDSPDIHPVGWSTKTGHPITFPPNFKADPAAVKTNCSTPCCRGDGHFRGLISETHDKVQDCPYSLENVSIEHHLTNRLDKSDKGRRKNNSLIGIDGADSASDSDEENVKYRWAFMEVRQEEVTQRKRLIKDKDLKKLEKAKKLSPVKRKLEDETSERDVNGNAQTVKRVKASDRVDKDVMTEPSIKTESIEPQITSDPALWTVKEVVENIKSLDASAADVFEREEICGLSLLALSQCDLLTDFELESATAFKIYTNICSLRERVKAVSFD